MLIRFSVENYRSFKERQSFTMLAQRQTRHDTHVASIGGKRVLKSSFLFGANASGKSNFIRAVDTAHRVILDGIGALDYYDKPFRIDSEQEKQPTVFQFDLYAKGHFYSYGFSLFCNTKKFDSEWLYKCDNGKEECIFERTITDENSRWEESRFISALGTEDKKRFEIYQADLSHDQLFLSEIVKKNLQKNAAFQAFYDVFNWVDDVHIIYPESTYRYADLLHDDISALTRMLSSFGTGITEIVCKSKPAEETFSFLPPNVRTKILNDVNSKLSTEVSEYGLQMGMNSYLFNKDEAGNLVAQQLAMSHGNNDDPFDLKDESDGTQRLFDLIPVYECCKDGAVFLIDEIDRSFHTQLTKEYIRRYFDAVENSNAQMIATTHDTQVLDLDLLRQDEIWFVERQADYSSKFSSLSEFKIRYDKNAQKDYLLGRYGAIPCFTQAQEDEKDE